MLRKLSILALFVVAASVGNIAKADVFFTQLGEINPPPGGAYVGGFQSWGNGGVGTSYVNVHGPLAANASFTALGVIQLGNTIQGNLGTGFATPPVGSSYVAVFALQGNVANPNPVNAVGVATAGAARIYQIPNATLGLPGFNTNPALWTSGVHLASWDLTNPADVTQGNVQADGTPFSAAQINNFAVNLVAPQQIQGRILFDEVAGAGTSLGNLINAITFDPFGLGNVVLPEQLLATFAENIDTTNPDSPNSVAADAFVALLVGGTPFSQGGFTPGTAGTPTPSGDFSSTLVSLTLVPGVQFAIVPEPASMLIWGTFAAAGALAYRRRRTTKA